MVGRMHKSEINVYDIDKPTDLDEDQTMQDQGIFQSTNLDVSAALGSTKTTP